MEEVDSVGGGASTRAAWRGVAWHGVAWRGLLITPAGEGKVAFSRDWKKKSSTEFEYLGKTFHYGLWRGE